MKKEMATMARDSRQLSPTAMMLLANCHVAALKASEIQYAMVRVSKPQDPKKMNLLNLTDKTQRAPFSTMKRDRIQIEVGPAGNSLCESRLGLGDAETGSSEYHRGTMEYYSKPKKCSTRDHVEHWSRVKNREEKKQLSLHADGLSCKGGVMQRRKYSASPSIHTQ
jgi:hypothetical protein